MHYFKNIIFTFLVLVVFCSISPHAFAKDNNYIYKKRLEWVKLTKLSKKQMAGQKLTHPFQNLTTDQLTNILVTLRLNKTQLFKQGFKSFEIFSLEEAQRFAPMLLKALAAASEEQVVNVAIVHKRPWFVIRNDFLSELNVYVIGEQIHFYFTKLFAKLDGDYEQASRQHEAASKAQDIRVSLAAAEGLLISANGKEVAVALNHNFSVAQTPSAESAIAQKEQQKQTHQELVKTRSAKSRLKTLDNLKKEGLISDDEYTQKREEILTGI